MKTKTDIEINDINESQAEIELAKQRDKILEDFSKAYLVESGLKPSQIELVSKQSMDKTTIETVYYFREKK